MRYFHTYRELMGLPAPVIEMLISEHCNRAINGNIAFIGKQTTFATEKSLRHFERKYKLKSSNNFPIVLDTQTYSSGTVFRSRIQKYVKRSPPLNLITDQCLMSFLGVNNFSAIDISDYEGADIICDLSQPIPKSLYGKFDFIFNGSCLDNIFNTAEAMRNISRLLKPRGRLVMIEHGTMFNEPYTLFSPEWFFDFFCYNGYLDCKVYTGGFNNSYDLHLGPWPLYLYNWNHKNINITSPVFSSWPANKYPILSRVWSRRQVNKYSSLPSDRKHIMYLIVAEKDIDSTDDQLPVQKHYRNKEFAQKIYGPQASRMLSSANPAFGISERNCYNSPHAFLHCGSLGKGIPF